LSSLSGFGVIPTGPAELVVGSLALLAVGAYLVWGLPRLGPRLAMVHTLALLAAGALACIRGAAWLVPALAVLAAGHTFLRLRGPRAPPGARRPAPPHSLEARATAPVADGETAPRLEPAGLGRYRLERQLGRGAMGVVYLGLDPQPNRAVAIKTMALGQEFEGDELADARARLFREAEAAGRLRHPDIVTVFEAGEDQGLAYIAMELIVGHDLQRYTQVGRLLPLRRVLSIVARVADALAYAHNQGVVHRDIKPANVMIDPTSDTVKVTDFGVARFVDACRTRTGVLLGTPSYMSPEQMVGARVDGRADIYALGVMLYQLLTGALPHSSDSMAELMRAIVNEPAPDVRALRPELPEALARIVAQALEKRPERRQADGGQLAAALRAVNC
jgi:serine/threonine-protein kinase